MTCGDESTQMTRERNLPANCSTHDIINMCLSCWVQCIDSTPVTFQSLYLSFFLILKFQIPTFHRPNYSLWLYVRNSTFRFISSLKLFLKMNNCLFYRARQNSDISRSREITFICILSKVFFVVRLTYVLISVERQWQADRWIVQVFQLLLLLCSTSK